MAFGVRNSIKPRLVFDRVWAFEILSAAEVQQKVYFESENVVVDIL